MDRGSRVTTPRRTSEELSDWSPICAELKNLQSDLLNVDGKRLRIEAVVGSQNSVDTLKHLCVHAHTPSHKDIVRYELESCPPGKAATELAELVSKAEGSKKQAEEVIEPLHERLAASGPYLFKTLDVERDPYGTAPMERRIPDFAGFAANPLSMDSAFSVDRALTQETVRAEATLYPSLRYTLLRVYSYPNDGSRIPAPLNIKVRPSRDFWEKPHLTEETMSALHSATFEAMHTLVSNGTARSALLLQDPELDANLKRGIVEPMMCVPLIKFPEKSRIMLEEGDTIACVRLESSEHERATAFTWRISSPHGLLLPDDPRLAEARKAVESMEDADPYTRATAIRKLNQLTKGGWDNLPDEPGLANPFNTSPLADITSPSIARALSSLSRSKVRVVKPSTDLLILDLTYGIRSVALDFRDPGHSRRNPHDPDTLFFGFGNDGSLKVFISSPLNNHLEAVVPASYFKEHGSIAGTVMRLAGLFNRQSQAGFFELRREIEWLAAFNGDNVSPSSSVFRDPRLRFPSTYSEPINKAFQTAAELALVYEADVPLASLSEVKLFTDDPVLCEMVVAKNSANAPASMHLFVSEVGVHGVDLRSASGGHYTFTLETPLALPEGRTVLTNLFRLLRDLPPHRTTSAWNMGDPITYSPLFNYLHECERRFAAS